MVDSESEEYWEAGDGNVYVLTRPRNLGIVLDEELQHVALQGTESCQVLTIIWHDVRTLVQNKGSEALVLTQEAQLAVLTLLSLKTVGSGTSKESLHRALEVIEGMKPA